MDEESLRRKTLVELKALLLEKGLKTNGKKEELIQRLLSAFNNDEKPDPADDSGKDAQTNASAQHSKVTPSQTSVNALVDDSVSVGSSPLVGSSSSPVNEPEQKNDGNDSHKGTTNGALSEEEKRALRAKRFNLTTDTKPTENKTKLRVKKRSRKMARNVETKNNTNISTKSSPVPNGRGRKQPLAMTNKVTKGPNNNRQNPVMNNRRINPRRNNANKQQQQNVKNTNNKQQDTTTKTEKRTRVDRRLKQKGVEGGVELDEAERARRAKRAARFNLKQ